MPLIVDGGQAQVGIESTVVDVTCGPPRVLRPGMIHEESLAAAAGPLWGGVADAEVDGHLRSPGQLPKHYAPRAGCGFAPGPGTMTFAGRSPGSTSTLRFATSWPTPQSQAERGSAA